MYILENIMHLLLKHGMQLLGYSINMSYVVTFL